MRAILSSPASLTMNRKGLEMRDKLAGLKESNAPLYIQLARNLREHIESGGVEPGEPLPSERELSERMGMSRVTIRKGIQKLIEEGLLFRRHGSGTYVTERILADRKSTRLNSSH